MAGIGLVFNPRAGRNKKDPDAPKRLARKLGDHGIVAAPRSYDELLRAAEDFKRHDIEVLGISGGDGTNHVTLTGFHQVYGTELPTVALLRGGTMNTVANALGLPRGKTEPLLDRLVRKYLETPKLPTLEQWTMDVEGKLGFLWGVGIVPGFLEAYYDTGAPSPWTAVKTLARMIGSSLVDGPFIQRTMKPAQFTIETDVGGVAQVQSYFSIAAGTVEDIGLGFRAFHRAHEQRGRFHLLGIQTTPLGFAAELPRIHRAVEMSPGKSKSWLAQRAVLRGRGPFTYMIDGDVLTHERDEMTVRIGPPVRIATMN